MQKFSKMLNFRSKSVEFHLDPEDNLMSAYSWKSNLLCGVYREEMTSSIFYTSHSDDRYVVKDKSMDRHVVRAEVSARDLSEEQKDKGKRCSWNDLGNNSNFAGMRRYSVPEDKKNCSFLKKLSLKMARKIHSPVLCTAVAIKDCFPSPYDKQALAFKTGDKIVVTSMNQNGIWRGYCNGRE